MAHAPVAEVPARDRVAVVTGAGRGLGRALAEYLFADGRRVALADIDAGAAERAAGEIDPSGSRTIAIVVDVTDETSTIAMAEAVATRWERIDILVNNAGLYGDHRFEPVLQTDAAYWDHVLAVNLRGPLLCSRAVIPVMRARGWGRIVNISSMGAHILGGVYSTSKLALNHVTWSLAAEVGADGITVNGVGPGTIDIESARRQNTPQQLADRVSKNLVKRLGHPQDVYGAVRYFASEDAEWCTGQTLMVNGGFNVHV